MEKNQSPWATGVRHFFRNGFAVAGLVILGILFAFSFLGVLVTPYRQDQVFYRHERQLKDYAALKENDVFRFYVAPGQVFGAVEQAQFSLKQEDFSWNGVDYTVVPEGNVFTVYVGDTQVATASLYVVPMGLSYDQTRQQLLDGKGDRLILQENGSLPGFRQAAEKAIADNAAEFTLSGRKFQLSYDAAGSLWQVKEQTVTQVWDAYSAPSREHLLGTDKNGMDVLTRLMYGGRVSLLMGFAVVLLCTLIGVTVGGVAGFFGGWTDSALMRLVDVFYCIPTTPLLIILGAAMDGLRVEPQLRLVFLILTLGLLSWPELARLVRGQILSLREQEFMLATEASGLGAGRRIFRHLLPNVLPQIIISATSALGSAILTEATLSFLGLGVKFPYASWGNMINDVSNAFVLTTYLFVWIPAGVCLVLAVLGFYFVGDGLRDAIDPRTKR